ncbi:hypothetical protein KKC59_01765 [bacterium]|nr:hypothetical protein [bacterium]
MFKITFSQLVVIYVALPLIVIFLSWLFIDRRKVKKKINLSEPILFVCPYCSHEFVNSASDNNVTKCPSCNNFCKKI